MKNRIAEIMNKENMTSLRFAQEIGIQPSAVSHILSGRNNPSMDVVQKILNAFKTINPDWLILGSGPMLRNGIEQTENKPIGVKITPNKPSMASLFSDESANDAKYRKEINSNARQVAPLQASFSTRQQETGNNRNPDTENTQPETKTTVAEKRIVKRIIIYYSDNTFEEYNMQLNKD
jgi:transcriptional regulator with XRE-family HTH domain